MPRRRKNALLEHALFFVKKDQVNGVAASACCPGPHGVPGTWSHPDQVDYGAAEFRKIPRRRCRGPVAKRTGTFSCQSVRRGFASPFPLMPLSPRRRASGATLSHDRGPCSHRVAQKFPLALARKVFFSRPHRRTVGCAALACNASLVTLCLPQLVVHVVLPPPGSGVPHGKAVGA